MKPSPPRVSIGLPVFNGENYLVEALDSILTQTYSDFELIISDNASTDKTRAICQEYAAQDERIHYNRLKENQGAAANFNGVFIHSRGRYFKWAAHDDLMAPTYLERCVPILDADPSTILVYPRTILIDGRGDVIEYHDDLYHLRSPRPHQRFRNFFHTSAWCHPVFGLIRREVLAHSGLIGSYSSSDRVLLGELAILGKTHEVPEHLAYRRLHAQISTVANQTDEEIAAWFDPGRRNRVIAPRFRRAIEYVKAIGRAELPTADRFLCFLELVRFYFSPGRLAGVQKDIQQIRRKLVQQVVPNNSESP